MGNLIGVGEEQRHYLRQRQALDGSAMTLDQTGFLAELETIVWEESGIFELHRRELSTTLNAQNALFRIRQTGGDMTIESCVGFGTRVEVRLPIAKQITVEVTSQATKSALLVEDDSRVSEAAMMILSKLGYAVTVCFSREQAVDVIKVGVFDLLLTDFELGGQVDGLTVLDQANHSAPQMRTILISGKLSVKEVALDKVNFVEKWITQSNLAQALAG